MKTKTFFFLCLLLGIATIKLSAQTGTDNYINPKWFDHYLGIFCDGVQVDLLKNEGYDLRQSVHYKDGEVIWWTGKVNNLKFTSQWTSQVFKVQVSDSWNEDLYHIRWNVIGTKGIHYVINEVYDGKTWTLISSSTDCH